MSLSIKIELEKSDVSIDLLCVLADYYNTSTGYLICNTDEIKPHKKSILYKEKYKKKVINNLKKHLLFKCF